MEWIAPVVLTCAAAIFGLSQSRAAVGIRTLGPGGGGSWAPPGGSFVVGPLLLLATLAGVGLNYLAFSKGIVLSPPMIAGAIGASLVTYLVSYSAKEDQGEIRFIEIMQYVKDGFLWTAASPGLAAALGATIAPAP